MPSTAPALTASFADEEAAFRTVDTAQATFRPRASAMAVMLAIVSLRTFWPSVPVMSCPPDPTGDAAPMLVPGAMSAMLPASVMNVPALAARAPCGATQVITGTGDSRMSCVIERIASSDPPGVSIWNTTAAAPSEAAWAIPSWT